MSTIRIFGLAVVLLLTAAGCKKEGEFIKTKSYAEVRAGFTYSNAVPVYYELSINNQVVQDSLIATIPPAGRGSFIEPLPGATNRLTLKEVSTGAIVLDTLISLTWQRNEIRFLQLSPDSPPFIAGGKDDITTLPLHDSTKIRFIYTDNDLPDSIYLKMYYTQDFATLIPIDHPRFSFARNIFSSYFTVANYTLAGNIYAFEMYNAKTDALVQKTEMDPANDSFLDGLLISADFHGSPGKLESYLLFKTISYNSPAAPNYLHYEEKFLFDQ
jgi:hypothetical protein